MQTPHTDNGVSTAGVSPPAQPNSTAKQLGESSNHDSSKNSSQSKSQQTTASAQLNGSEILVKALQAENVKYLWGYPGGAVLYIYDALYKQDTIQHVLVRHE